MFNLVSIIALSLVVAVALILSLAGVVGLLSPYLPDSQSGLLPGVAISSGVLVAILAYYRDKTHQQTESLRKKEGQYLSLVNDSFVEVHRLLEDQNNDRIVWVRAARLLLHALALKEYIQTPDLLEAYKLAEEKLRSKLYQTLSFRNDVGIRQSLPPQFFYGIDDWATEASLDEAALKSGSAIEAHFVSIDQNIPEPKFGHIAARSVIAVYDFLDFPEEYQDPLQGVQNWDDNWEDSTGISQGAKRYVAHTKIKTVIDGKLVDLNR